METEEFQCEASHCGPTPQHYRDLVPWPLKLIMTIKAQTQNPFLGLDGVVYLYV